MSRIKSISLFKILRCFVSGPNTPIWTFAPRVQVNQGILAVLDLLPRDPFKSSKKLIDDFDADGDKPEVLTDEQKRELEEFRKQFGMIN